MNFQWILLALFLMAMVSNIAKSMRNPMLKNVLRLISIFVAFIFTFILQVCGVFQSIITGVVADLEIAKMVPKFEGVIANAIDFVIPFCTTFLSPLLFALVFFITLLILRIVHVNLVYKFIVRRQRRREIREFKRSLREEKDRLKQAITENEERFLAVMQEMSANNPELATYTYETLNEDEIERMVEQKLKAEKKNKKRKPSFFRESKDRKAISIVCGVIAGFILFAVTWMGMFYTMDVISDITSIVDETAADDNKIYAAIEMVDDQLVEPYESTFVFRFYKNMGMVKLMSDTVKYGGKLEVDGQKFYADEIVRDQFKAALRLSCEMTSGKENAYNNVAEDMKTLTTNPMVVSILADVIIDLLAEYDVPEADSGDPMSGLWANILGGYKNEGGKNSIVNDLGAMSSFAEVTAKHRLLQTLINGETDGLIKDKELVKDMVSAMSELSFYAPTMDTIFTFGVDALGNALVPANSEEGYKLFVNSIVKAANDGVQKLTNTNEFGEFGGELAAYEAFMTGGATYEVLEDNKYQGILGYMVNPLYTIKGIQEEAKVLKEQADAMLADAANYIEYTDLLGLGDSRDVEQQQRFEELQAWVEEKGLTDPTAIVDEIIRLEAASNALMEEINGENGLTVRAKAAIEEFKSNVNGFKPFITYLVNWMNVQKPFMVANEDYSTACLAFVATDAEGVAHIYICNIDEVLTLERILDLWNDDGGLDGIFNGTSSNPEESNPEEGNPEEGNPEEGNPEEGNPEEGNPEEGNPEEGNPEEGNPEEGNPEEGNPEEGGSDDSDDPVKEEDKDSVLDFDIDLLIEQSLAPVFAVDGMRELLTELAIFEADPEADAKRVSEHTKLINYIIYSAIDYKNDYGASNVSEIWLYQTLAAYSSENGCSSSCECVACRIYAAYVNPTNHPFDYKGVTTEMMKEALNFGDEWTTEAKKKDSAMLAEIVFSLLDLVEVFGEGGAETDVDALVDLLGTLGSVMDQMAKTTCLGELPEYMLGGILKNDKLSAAITPEMLYGEKGYMIRLENDDLTYEGLMKEIAATAKTVLEKLTDSEGGN